MADRTGQQVGNYHLVRLLGEGGFAQVYLGEHIYLKTYAAIKLLRHAVSEEDTEQFLQEACIQAQMEHPCILKVIDYAVAQKIPLLVMSYASGGTLRKRYADGSRLPMALILKHVKQVAAALQYAHDRNVIHRDVKPDNMLLLSDERVVLSDFGLALLVPSPELLSLQDPNGTRPYMAPEQIQGKPTFATDQYALGVVTYEWLCGVRPFKGNLWEIWQQHLFEPPPSLRSHYPDIPESIENVVLKALAKDPLQRFVRVQEFTQALEEASRQQTIVIGNDPEKTEPRGATVTPPSQLVLSTEEGQTRAQGPYKVFLAHAPVDIAFAQRLKADLRQRDVQFVDTSPPAQAGAEDKEEELLRDAMRSAQRVLVVVTQHTRSSRIVREQLRMAGMYQHRLVFIWAEGEGIIEMLQEAWSYTISVEVVDAREMRYPVALDEIISLIKTNRPTSPGQISPIPWPKDPRNPYKGLRSFRKDDEGDFFGRSALIGELVQCLKVLLMRERPRQLGARLLTIIGPSGSGKSSVVMAGLLPRLLKGALPGSEHWIYLNPMVPGRLPIGELARVLEAQLPRRGFNNISDHLYDDSARGLHRLVRSMAPDGKTKVVLLIDQFEELFSPDVPEQQRQQLIDLLLTAIREPSGPLIVLLTLRADFYDRPMRYPVLSSLIAQQSVQVPSMELRDLRAVIEQPAMLPGVQLSFEGSLLGDLLFEAQGQAGILPFLEFVLDELYRRREGHMLTEEAYHKGLGGVKGVLTNYAQATYQALPTREHQELARTLFLRLVDLGKDAQESTRRRTALSDLEFPDPRRTTIMQKEVIKAFVDARLLVASNVDGTSYVEVSHEVLIREWKQLVRWLSEKREDIFLQQTISANATEWIKRNRPVDRLYRDSELSEALLWRERNDLNREEQEFLDAAVAEQERREQLEQTRLARELKLGRQSVNRLRVLTTTLTLFLVAIIIFSGFMVINVGKLNQANIDLNHTTTLAHSDTLVADARTALLQHQYDQALLLSDKASQIANTPETRASLFTSLEQSAHITAILSDAQAPVDKLVFAPSRQFLVSSYHSRVDVWNLQTKRPTRLQLDKDQNIGDIVVTSDNTVVTSSTAGIQLWDVNSGKQISSLLGRMPNIPSGITPLTPLTVTQDGKAVVYARCNNYVIQSGNYTCQQDQIFMKDLPGGHDAGLPFPLAIPQEEINSLALSADGTLLAVGTDKSVHIWNRATRGWFDPLPTDGKGSASIAFNADGTRLAYARGNSVQLWDTGQNLALGSPLIGPKGSVTGVTFTPDGQTLAASSQDQTVQFWNMTTMQQAQDPITSSPDANSSLAFSPVGPDGETLAIGSGGNSGTIVLWNLDRQSILLSQVISSTIDGSCCVLLGSDGLAVFSGDVTGKVFYTDIRTGKSLVLFDTLSHHPLNPLPSNFNYPPASIMGLALSHDGHILAAGRADGTLLLWDVQANKERASFDYPPPLTSLGLSSNGRFVATGGNGKDIQVLDIATKKLLKLAYHSTASDSTGPIALSPDGGLLAAGSCSKNEQGICIQGQVLLWNAMTGKPYGKPLRGHAADITNIVFSPDKQTLASTSNDGTIILWNAIKGQQESLSLSLPTVSYSYNQLLFSLDGKRLVASSQSGASLSVAIWDVQSHTLFISSVLDKNSLGGSMAFYPDGQHLLILVEGSSSNALKKWDLSIQSWREHACTIASRDLTEDEWHRFIPYESYHPFCRS